jgi:hypothetical protein
MPSTLGIHFRRTMLLGILLSGSPAFAALTPTFVILRESKDRAAQVRQVEAAGGRVRHIVPPSIIEADLPPSLGSVEKEILTRFVGPVPVSQLESMGPLAVAAGLRWNKTVVTRSKAVSSSAFKSMSAAVAKESIQAPVITDASPVENTLSLKWSSSRGALIYEIQAAADEGFSTGRLSTFSDRTSVTLPLEPSAGSIFVRVRALDRSGETLDVTGPWSTVRSVPISAATVNSTDSTLTPTSPADGMESTGFSLVLEWMGAAQRARIQISKSAAFDSTLTDEVVTGTEHTVPSSMIQVGEKIFWRVKSWNPSGPWSVARTITIGAPRASLTDALINPEQPQ